MSPRMSFRTFMQANAALLGLVLCALAATDLPTLQRHTTAAFVLACSVAALGAGGLLIGTVIHRRP
ncbi:MULTISPECIES: hypothetical protein [unclassified Nocardia]|uniref:hypothetical protein n=1 Tax=unclassified Nocardia TaxID=2637762 RepID=UPI00278C37D3|nr:MULTISPECIES: hypothetical protein [unclassified Nocardia]